MICQRRTDAMACYRCEQRLDEWLEEILEYVVLLPAIEEPGTIVMDDMPHGSQPFPAAPIRLDVVDILDQRPSPLDGDSRSKALAQIASWARLVREDRRLADETGNDSLVYPHARDMWFFSRDINVLRVHLSWVCEQPWVDEFHAEVKERRREILQAWGESNPKPIGRCPAELIKDGQVQTCGATLWAPIYGDVVRCSRCKASWTEDRWRLLGQVIGVIGGEAS